MADTARPVNGASQGVWNERGGYGLVNALGAMDQLAATIGGGNIVDDGGPNFIVAGDGWQPVFTKVGTYGGDYGFHQAVSGIGTAPAVQYYFNFLKKGTYDILAHWVPSANRTTQARYDVWDGDLFEGTTFLNQQRKPATSAFGQVAWQRVNRIVVTQSLVLVQLSASTTGTVSADGVRLKFISSSTSGGAGNDDGSLGVVPDAVRPASSNSLSNSAATSHAQQSAATVTPQDAALLSLVANESEEVDTDVI
jgi:hypothetical protein